MRAEARPRLWSTLPYPGDGRLARKQLRGSQDRQTETSNGKLH